MELSTIAAAIPGPWGVAIGIGLTLLSLFIRNRMGSASPATPTAPAAPAAEPAPSSTPVLDGLFAFLKAKFGAAPASAAQDLTHEAAADLLGKLFGVGANPTPPPK